MISSLRGRVLHLDAESAIVEVGGVGFSVSVPAALARSLHVGDETTLHTALIVREDALSLFGFADREELTVFHHLLSVSGVGPKSALGVLSSLSVDQIAHAVADEDDAPFRRVSGIGPKTAKLIVVQLAGKLHVTGAASRAAAGPASGDIAGQVVAALTALGWNERTSVEAVTLVLDAATDADSRSVPVLLKLALAQLGPARPERAGV
ncbi:Holliday junction branch migration protein RuvA [Microbacterium laevaniformans]|uniref:Holliday junction branch migration complex subunit RuvA n=1 Tax=Microbacterium laevaniformans TaxID=36807 RepID=A0A4S2D760_9MICO|nr:MULTISPECIES: Holliday junction branch migration protein RuvA [Microbacterium]AXA95900.1 Holliday junction branch migration protein RuvA [Microbacterium sp. PM5]MDC7802660.1 Holliday junction branch migration protein RuvA [Sphingomonas sp. BLCC-B65]TGY37507.1 Holliday junction branch migration protein RuvA [Microbacterium laevaniformans]